MKRSRLRHKFLKSGSDENRKRYTKQRNLCVSLLRKTKKNYDRNITEKIVTDNKILESFKTNAFKQQP